MWVKHYTLMLLGFVGGAVLGVGLDCITAVEPLVRETTRSLLGQQMVYFYVAGGIAGSLLALWMGKTLWLDRRTGYPVSGEKGAQKSGTPGPR